MTDVVDLARAWIGTPYLHQQSRRGVGADCLGLVRGVWREVRGAEPWVVPRYSGDWGEISEVETLRIAADRWLEPCKPEPGAVVLFRMLPRAIAKHGGIYTGTSLIHAREGLGVIEEPWTDAWARRCIGAWRF